LETEKIILEDLLSSLLSQFEKYHSTEDLKFNNLGNFCSLKFRILMGKFLSISLKLNFSPNTLGCYGLMQVALTYSNLAIPRIYTLPITVGSDKYALCTQSTT